MKEITIERLEEIRTIYQRFNILQREREEAYQTYKSPIIFYEHQKGSDTLSDPVVKAFHRIEEIDNQLCNVLDKMIEFEDDLQKVPDLGIVAIIRWHYLIGLSWSDTNYKIYKEHNSSYCRKKIQRYFL